MQRCRYGLRPVYRLKFLHDVVDMVIDRPFANAQDNGNIPGTFTLLQPVEDFFFPVREDDDFIASRGLTEGLREGEMEMGDKETDKGDSALIIWHGRTGKTEQTTIFGQ